MHLLPIYDMLTAAALGLFAGLIRMLLYLNTGRAEYYPLCNRWKWLAQLGASIFVSELFLYIGELNMELKRSIVPIILLSGFCSIELVELFQVTFLQRVKVWLRPRDGEENGKS